MKKIMEPLQAWLNQWINPILSLVVLAVLTVLLYQWMEKPLLGTRLAVWTGYDWRPLAVGRTILLHAWPLTLVAFFSGWLFARVIQVFSYELMAGADYRRRLANAEEEALRIARAELREQARRLQMQEGWWKSELEALRCRTDEAEKQAEMETRRADAAELTAEVATKRLAEVRKSNAQGAAERQRRKHRRNARDDDDANPNPARF
ncbi:hypothetical protein [Pseudomonas sp. BN102]|uniref:hypothetical protein n=1 Tax=Pseudomonas sp. BN102 TaxID=2567886 RepID=UPI002458D234|nr:hypothetical protein [Pseudomonas sp. BN102]MDH4610331.1 hypothetical protein [Pseudomonas sp. BN102]